MKYDLLALQDQMIAIFEVHLKVKRKIAYWAIGLWVPKPISSLFRIQVW